MSTSLPEAIVAEMARIRDHIMPVYVEIGPAGTFALAIMRAALDEAARALAEGDPIAQIRVLEDLRGFDT